MRLSLMHLQCFNIFNFQIFFFIIVSFTNGEMSKSSAKKKRSFGFGAFNGDPHQDNNYYNDAFASNDGYHFANPHQHTHSHTLVTKKFGFPVPQPYPVPYPVKVTLTIYRRNGHVTHISYFQVPIERPVPYPVPVHHHHPVSVPYIKHVRVPVPIIIPKPYAVPIYPKPHYHHDHFSSWHGGIDGGHGYW